METINIHNTVNENQNPTEVVSSGQLSKQTSPFVQHSVVSKNILNPTIAYDCL